MRIETKNGDKMPGIGTTIRLNDGVTKTARSISQSINSIVNSFKTMQKASDSSLNTRSYSSAQSSLNKIRNVYKDIVSGIKQSNKEQQNLNKNISTGSKFANDLQKNITRLVAAYVSLRTVLKGLTTSDSLTTNNLRIASINDGTQTDAALRNSLYDAANRSGANYLDFSNYVTGMGISGGRNFSGTAEVTKFVELLYKQFQANGVAEANIGTAMNSISEAIDTGKLESGGVKNIIAYAPQLANEIARVSGTTVEGLKELAGQGGITADVLKKALFSIEDSINEQYAKVPAKFSDMWALIKNEALRGYEDASAYLSKLVNMDSFKQSAVYVGNFIGDITKVFGSGIGRLTEQIDKLSQNKNVVVMINDIKGAALSMFEIILRLVDIAAAGITVLADNWNWLKYVILAVAVSLTIYKTAAIAATVATKLTAISTAAADLSLKTLSIASISAATGISALTLSLFWIIGIVVAIVAGFYLFIWVLNKLTGESVSATGIITGVFAGLFAYLQNGIAFWYNIVAAFAEFFSNVFKNPVYSIQRLFANLYISFIDFVISGASVWGSFANSFANMFIAAINKVKGAWNSLAGSSIGQFLGLNTVEMTANVDIGAAAVQNLENFKAGINGYMEANMPENYKVYDRMQYKDIGAAANAGYNWGANAENSISGHLSGTSLTSMDSGLTTTGNVAYGSADTGLSNSSGTIAELRDYARRENYGSAGSRVVNIEMNNDIVIQNGMNEEDVVSLLVDAVEEAINSDAEGSGY